MNRIHVCWRPGEDEQAGEEIVRRLRERLGALQVFSGMAGLERHLREGDWLLLVIGPGWSRELDGEDGLIRTLGTVLPGARRVIPLLVGGVALPPAERLPETLRSLAGWQPLVLTRQRWEFDFEWLLGRLLGPLAGGGTPVAKAPPKEKEILHAHRNSELGSRAKQGLKPQRDLSIRTPAAGGVQREKKPGVAAAPAIKNAKKSALVEEVWLGAAAPTAVKPGGEFIAHFAAYVKAQEGEVQRLLTESSPRSQSHLGVERCRWRHGTRVVVRLRGRGLVIDPPEQDFVWSGGRNLLPFDVEVPKDAPEATVVLKFDVSIDEVVVARLRMDLAISAKETGTVRQAPTIQPARTAFASYSSTDRSRVLDRVDALTTNAGIDFYLDCIDLHQGEEWKPALAEAIHRQELFMLFWSRHSAASPWVDWELETAKQAKAREFIQIQALQPDFPPPKGFEAIHGSSVYLWVREGNEAVRNRPGAP